MIEPVTTEHERTAARQINPDVAARLRPVTTIVDEVGGGLALALADDDARAMAHAISLLVAERLAHGSMVKVTTRERVFALSRVMNRGEDAVIRVSDVYNPRACVHLSLELAELVATLLAASGELRAQMPSEEAR